MNTLDDVEYGLEEIASMESFGLKLGKFIGLITVEENDKWVTISNINTHKFAKDLLKHFGTSILIKHMFKQVKPSSLVVHKFFLIDLEYMLRKLEQEPKSILGKRSYIKIREELKLNTWIGRITSDTPSIFNLNRLKDIKFSLLKHQDEFINYYDLNPDTKGKVGQIGKWYHDDNERRVAVVSLKDLAIDYNVGVNPIKTIKNLETKHNIKMPNDVVTWYTQKVMESWYIENNYRCKPLPVFAIETTDFEIDGVLSIATFEYIDGEYISYVLKGNEKYKTGNMVGVSSIGDTIYNVAANSLKDFKQGKFKTKLHALFTEERPDTSKDKPNKTWWKFWG